MALKLLVLDSAGKLRSGPTKMPCGLMMVLLQVCSAPKCSLQSIGLLAANSFHRERQSSGSLGHCLVRGRAVSCWDYTGWPYKSVGSPSGKRADTGF
jgi:hypothetical protein